MQPSAILHNLYHHVNTAEELRAHGYREASLEIAERAISWYKAHKDKNERLGLAWTFYHDDRREASLTLYEESHKESPDNVDYIGLPGVLAARMGEKEMAMWLLREALGQRVSYSWLHPYMNLEPLWN